MEELKEQVDTILKNIPNEQFQNMIAYVANHYGDSYTVDKEFIEDFLITNFGAGIWYDSLSHSLSESNYNQLVELEENDWEKADFIGSWIGEYIIEHVLHDMDSI